MRVTVQRRVGRSWKKLRIVDLTAIAGTNRNKLARLPRRGSFRFVLLATDAAGNVSGKVTRR